MADSSATDYSKRLVDNTLADRKMDSSSKNALYNQRLTGYLKQKKADEDRPVKVAINDDQIALLQQTTSKKREISPPKNITKRVRLISPPKQTEIPTVTLPTTPTTPINPITIKSNRSPASISKEITKNQIIKTVKDNKDKFGITTGGNIKDSKGSPIMSSNYSGIIDYIAKGMTGRDLPGTAILLDRLKRNPLTKDLLVQLLHLNSPARASKPKSISPFSGTKLNIGSWR